MSRGATRVINLHHGEPYDVYAGRPREGKDPRAVHPGQHGYLGNPFPLGKNSRDESIRRFAAYFYQRVDEDDDFREFVLLAKDKTLACFCKPKPCHADIIAAWLEEHQCLT